jgi:L-rhamnose-H+ transport protein
VIYIFSNTGAYLSTLIYCAYLHRRDGTFHEFFSLPEASGQSVLLKNYGLAWLTGILWYAQFFFYGLGHVNLGAYQFSSWAIHMIMLVMFSAILGIFMKEWVSVRSGTRRTLGMALFVLLISILMITFGNYAGA